MGRHFNDYLENLGDASQRYKQFESPGGDSLTMTRSDTEVVGSWPIPICSTDIERFIVLAKYHRNFVNSFSKLSDSLYIVFGKNNFRCEPEQQAALEALKGVMTQPPIQPLPNSADSFILDTDVSDVMIGAEMSQVRQGNRLWELHLHERAT